MPTPITGLPVSTDAAADDVLLIVDTGSGQTRQITVQDFADTMPGGGGDVTGPVSSTDNAIARFNGTDGAVLQNSLVTVNDSGNITLPALATVDGRDLSVDGTKLDGIEAGADVTDATNVQAALLAFVLDGQSVRRVGSEIQSAELVPQNGAATLTTVTFTGVETGSSPNRYRLNATLSGPGGFPHQIYVSEVSPAGLITTEVGSLCVVRYPSANANDGLWVKSTGGFDSTGWVQLGAGGGGGGVTDHGALTGLADDDHTQYLLADGSRTLSGNLTITGTVDGRDVSADGTKLDGIEAGADVTDATNVTSALVGLIADGQVPRRSGSTIVGAAYGDVAGPASATDNALVRMDGTGGKTVQSSLVTLSDTGGLLTGPSGAAWTITGGDTRSTTVKGGEGTGGGAAGALFLDAGKNNGGGGAAVSVGPGEATAVSIGRTGITTTVLGTLEADVLFARQRVAQWIEEFPNGIAGISVAALAAGTGAGTIGVASEVGTMGVVQLSTGTTSTGRAGLFNTSGLGSTRIDADGAVWFDAHVRIPTLSDGTETFVLYAGLGNAQNAEPTQGAYFTYDSTTSANWIIKSANSVRTAETTAVAVTTDWTRLSIRLAADNTSVSFFINGVQVGSAITTNLPATGQGLSITINNMKSVGTTARTCLVDYVAVQKFFNTAR